jgi:hypothetical protein
VSGTRAIARLARTGPPAQRTPLDAVSFLTVFVVLLFGVPTDHMIIALGSLGSPALLWAVLGGLWWCWHQLQRSAPDARPGFTPVRVAALLYLAAVAVSFVGAMFRGLPSPEASPADTGIMKAFAWIGLLLLVSDGIPSYERLLVLVRRIAVAGALLGLLGLAQFATGQSLLDWISIPGFSPSDDETLQVRSGFIRPPGTASHPLEYGYVLATVMPLALTLALWDASRSALRRWTPVALIVAAAALAVSRSTILGLAVGVAVLILTWTARMRVIAVGVVIAVVGAVYFVVPGMVGAIAGLFGGLDGSDSSASSRIGSYDLVLQFVSRSPVVGRGVGTFLPEYRILDNQLLQSLIEIGVLGVIALLALCVTVAGTAMFARTGAAIERRTGQGIAASAVVGTVLLGTFDVFSFPMATGLFFLVLGLGGAHYRLRSVAPAAV